jgi:hypothetical protein
VRTGWPGTHRRTAGRRRGRRGSGQAWAASPARSAQGKDSWELVGASGRVVGEKRGRVERGEGGHLSVAHRELQLSLSPSLYSERERVGSAPAPVRGVER